MKKRSLLYLVLTIAGAGWLGTLVAKDPGYAVLAYDGAVIQTSFWVFLLLIGTGYFVLGWGIKLVRFLLASSFNVNEWRARQRQQKAREQANKGLVNLSEGNWIRAERYLSASADASERPLVNYLAAARAAQAQGKKEKRDEFLHRAVMTDPKATLAVGMTQAELQILAGEWEQSLASLKNLPRNPEVLKLLKRVMFELEDWSALWELLPELRKMKSEDEADLKAMEETALTNLIIKFPESSSDLQQLMAIWKRASGTLKEDPRLLMLYIKALVAKGAERDANDLIKSTLKSNWIADLVSVYAGLQTIAYPDRIKTLEGWQKKHADDATLMLALGRLYLQSGNVDKGQEMLENSLLLYKNAEAFEELGKLSSNKGNFAKSAEYFQLALAAAGNSK